MSSSVKDIILYPIQIHNEAPLVDDLYESIRLALESILGGMQGMKLQPGSRIGVTAGSRGIANYITIMSHTIRILQDKGHFPFIFSAMGSHGRGEAEGQQEVLDSLGIVAAQMGCQVSCSSQVLLLQELEAFGVRLPIYCAQEAMEADGVIVLNRIKPHTSFRGDYESGLLKMITVGMGRAPGANSFHNLGAGLLGAMIPLMAKVLLDRSPILGGIAIVENANEQTALIEGIPAGHLFAREKELLVYAKELMPKLPMNQADLCIIREMGKNFSGTGMDTNIIGRMRVDGMAEPDSPRLTYIGVLRLSEASNGNANGIGLADFTTDRLFNAIDRRATYFNGLTTGFVNRAAIPMIFPTDLELLEAAMQSLNCKDVHALRMVLLKNTLHLDQIWVTEPIYREIADMAVVSLAGEASNIAFSPEGSIIWTE
ncbi:DUF2088 domain-containing protein [Paenibacillus agricola]|uniref:DUF2088 domain-containing protein n=1 Tax=Paenibacillus agricola TaxID=2716264 RepID=A0ABX0JJ34_9BACL|nr:DUF2088 domain-containing protein [Paenibacillus agricola]NHN35037.1 DUF2088 domain-containing protein [Paenibacillus agricola]